MHLLLVVMGSEAITDRRIIEKRTLSTVASASMNTIVGTIEAVVLLRLTAFQLSMSTATSGAISVVWLAISSF